MKQYLICVKATTTNPACTDGGFEIHTSTTKDEALVIIANLCYKTLCKTLEQISYIPLQTGAELADFLLGNSADNQEPILRYGMFEQGMPLVYDDMNFLFAHGSDEHISSIGIEFHLFCQSFHKINDEPVPEFAPDANPVPVDISTQDIVNIITKLNFETINA